jgi:exopolysaccharide production protein ExoQ
MEQTAKSQSTHSIWSNIEVAITIWLLVLSEATFIQFPKLVSYGLVAFLLLKHWRKIIYVATRDLPLFLLVFIASISVLWSAAPDVTSDEIDLVWRSTAFGIYIATRYTPKEQMRLMAWVCGIAAILSLLYVFLLPSVGISITNGETTWQGIYQQKQYLGRVMTIGCVVFILNAIDSQKHRWIYLVGFSLTAFILLQSRSKTSLVLLILSLSILPVQKFIKQHYKLKVVILAISILLICGISILILGNLQTIVVDTLGKDLTFSGRTDVWVPAIAKGLERPILGYGFSGFWASSEASYILNSTWAALATRNGLRFHAHNGLIDLFLQLGFVGLLLFVVGFISTFARVIYLLEVTKRIEFVYMLQLLTLKLLFNTTESITILSGNIFWPLYVSTVLSSIVQLHRVKVDISKTNFHRQNEHVTEIESTAYSNTLYSKST